MLQRLSPWLAAGFTTGVVVLLGLWLTGLIYFNTFLMGQRPAVDQKLAAKIIETSLNNPEVQTILKQQVMAYMKSPEGKARMTEMMKSPEMVKTLSENIHSPEMQAAILKLMAVPEFRAAVLAAIKDTPEMKLLALLSSAIVLDQPGQETIPPERGAAQ